MKASVKDSIFKKKKKSKRSALCYFLNEIPLGYPWRTCRQIKESESCPKVGLLTFKPEDGAGNTLERLTCPWDHTGALPFWWDFHKEGSSVPQKLPHDFLNHLMPLSCFETPSQMIFSILHKNNVHSCLILRNPREMQKACIVVWTGVSSVRIIHIPRTFRSIPSWGSLNLAALFVPFVASSKSRRSRNEIDISAAFWVLEPLMWLGQWPHWLTGVSFPYHTV